MDVWKRPIKLSRMPIGRWVCRMRAGQAQTHHNLLSSRRSCQMKVHPRVRESVGEMGPVSDSSSEHLGVVLRLPAASLRNWTPGVHLCSPSALSCSSLSTLLWLPFRTGATHTPTPCQHPHLCQPSKDPSPKLCSFWSAFGEETTI